MRGAQPSGALARACADEMTARTSQPRFVAGVLGPTNRTASLSRRQRSRLPRSQLRHLRDAYFEEGLALMDGGGTCS